MRWGIFAVSIFDYILEIIANRRLEVDAMLQDYDFSDIIELLMVWIMKVHAMP
jgi:hypothetical protein